eukprot:CAMPEP_0202694576 /NCGR_PEP_ID=MMETSP1385-20130828/8401_1 /ASSEMBLY_ACC=CAM_ASM_000861 /TAXON_ID=933848 /ORGANISM="Elphidium margaritaceum" /LENGTH=697 /DNA_ID=CAMNT_0049350445 /DNA_START=418 /DNA_END=2511 /DNA_ORIENTATION=+
MAMPDHHDDDAGGGDAAECKVDKDRYQWRLETDDAECIETEHDWCVLGLYLNNTSAADTLLQLTLHLFIEDKQEQMYDPEMPSFVKCYKNPLTAMNERPPPPPYKPSKDQPTPVPNGAASASYPNLYAPSTPYFGYSRPWPPPHYAHAPPSHAHSHAVHASRAEVKHDNSNEIAEILQTHSQMLSLVDAANSPPSKRRKFSALPVSVAAIANGSQTVVPVPVPMQVAAAANPSQYPMPTAPPSSELLEANPYGVVYTNGYVWCDPCHQWFEVHIFDSHLQGKKHTKNIQAFSFRKVLKHWQSVRTDVLHELSGKNIQELAKDDNLWYAQICLCCLSEVQHMAWKQHAYGQIHLSNFTKAPRVVSLPRKMPPGNEGCSAIPNMFGDKYLVQILNYVPGSKILVLGEQDFSFSLAVCNMLQSGVNVVGTSYLGAYDATSTEPEEHPADDGLRANYFRRTLPSHNNKLEYNLQLLKSSGARVAHSIDATKLLECLSAVQPPLYCGPFDIIVFPFPRASLKRGTDFRNSTLIQGFFYELNRNREKLLYAMSQVQMIILDNQFKEWDIANIAKENGWTLRWRCCVNFASLPPYQPRELSGKAWSPKDARLLVFLWDEHFEKQTQTKLTRLNEMNDLALLPDEAMKVAKEAESRNAAHLNGIRQHNSKEPTTVHVQQNGVVLNNAPLPAPPSRLQAPPSSLER